MQIFSTLALSLSLSLFTTNSLAAPTPPATGDSPSSGPSGANEIADDNTPFRELLLDPDGFIHVAGDGIARSYDGKGNVIDYHVLNNHQLLGHADQTYGDTEPGWLLREMWADIDGNNVPEDQRINPPEDLKPQQFRSGGKDQTPNEPQLVEDHLLGKRAKTPPRCYAMTCHNTDSCRVAGCYACIQSAVQFRHKQCVLRPYWYPKPAPLVWGPYNCVTKGKRGVMCN